VVVTPRIGGLDNSLQYIEQYRGMRFRRIQVQRFHRQRIEGLGLQLGGDFAGTSVDVFYTDVKDAISAALLTAEQVAQLPRLGYSSSDSLSRTISDNPATASWV
jgi:hypothetical protein